MLSIDILTFSRNTPVTIQSLDNGRTTIIDREKTKNSIATWILSLLGLGLISFELAYYLASSPVEQFKMISIFLQWYDYCLLLLGPLAIYYFYHAMKFAKRRRKLNRALYFIFAIGVYTLIVTTSLLTNKTEALLPAAATPARTSL